MTGFYGLSIYEDAMRSDGGILTVDLLNGRVIKGIPSSGLASAILRIPAEFDRLCRAKGLGRNDCKSALAHFYTSQTAQGFTLVVEDSLGKVTEADYEGIPARRVVELDHLGRARRKAIRQP
ncbi:MAG TPA: hypothetical protein VNS02_08405 [Rhizobiaceae bacterium]|nr:hypothetical protein [Rhizobiaceae bacterium]